VLPSAACSFSRTRDASCAMAKAPSTSRSTVAAAAFLALAYWFAPPRPAGAPAQPVVERVRAGAAELVASATRVLQPAPAPEPAPPTTPPATPHTERSGRPARSPRQLPPPDGVVSLRSIDSFVVPDEPEVAPAPAPAPSDERVYTSADPDVTPAALLRPHLPSEPPSTVSPDDIGTLELMVTETGRVTHVRLISATVRYQERMLVAAAKTWRFQPAMKDGRPVRFRARVRITV
jgi:periplasmic protein TonB